MVVRGTARAPAQNRPELCVGQAESKPGQGERRAAPLCGHGNRPARGGCAGRGALAPTPRKRRPLHARYLCYIISARPAQASAGTARQNLQCRNRQAEPYCRARRPRRSKKICLPPLTMPQPHAILIKFPAGRTSYRGVEQLVARRAHNPEVAGSSPVPATTKHVETSVSACFFLLQRPTPTDLHTNVSSCREKLTPQHNRATL